MPDFRSTCREFVRSLPDRPGQLLLTGYLAMLWISLETATWLFPGYVVFLLAGVPVGCVYLARTSLASFFAWGLAGLLLYLTYLPIFRWQERESRRRGEQLAAGIERFKHDTGHYPTDLSELVPKYTSRIPRTAFGVLLLGYDFEYYTRREDARPEFWIMFGTGAMVTSTYSSRYATWSSHD